MNLKAILDEKAFESLPETIDPRALFQKNEKDNNYVLAIPGTEAAILAKPLQDEVTRLKAHNEKLLGEKDQVQDKLKPFTELGKTPEELTALITDKTPQDIATLTQTHKAELESIKASTKAELDAATTALAEFEAEMLKDKKFFAIDKAMRDQQATPLAVDYLTNRVVVQKVEGTKDYVVRVLDDNGEIAYKAGQPMTPAQLLEEKKTDPIYSGMFFAGDGGGTGNNLKPSPGISSKGTIRADDVATFGANLDDIASGKVKVVGLGN